jgi:hypothetical protein
LSIKGDKMEKPADIKSKKPASKPDKEEEDEND